MKPSINDHFYTVCISIFYLYQTLEIILSINDMSRLFHNLKSEKLVGT